MTENHPAVKRLAVTLAALAAALSAGAAHTQSYDTWRTYGGGAHSAQYSALDQIDKGNVAELEIAWTFPAGERNVMFNPIVVDGVMYVLARDGDIVALDAASGRELWARPSEGRVGDRGINYWQSADGRERRLLFIDAGFLTAIDARDGKVVAAF